MERFDASPFNTNWQNLTGTQKKELEKANIDERVWNSWNSAAKSTTSSAANSTTDFNKGQSELTGTISKNLSLWTNLADSIRGAEGAQSTLTSLTNIAVASLEKEQTIRKSIVKDLGQVGQLQQMQNETIMQASIEAQRYGVSLDDVLRTTVALSQEMGRNVLMSDEDISRLSIFTEAIGLTTSQTARMVTHFDQMGLSVGEAIDKGNEMANVARQMGLNVGEFMDTISQNMSMMNTYNFSDGVRGFAKMAAQAQKLGISMATTATLAEKVMDPEGAIELAANLQVIGGAVGDLADPFKLMYMATNDLGALQDSLVQAGQELAVFNEETGEISFPPTAQRQLRAMADALGMNKDELASMIKLQTKFQAVQNQFSFDLEGREDMQEFVTSMASLNQQTGKYEIKVPGLEQAVEIEDLTASQLDKLKEVQDQQQMTEKELMAEQTGILQSIDDNTKALDAALLGGVMEGLDVSEISTNLSQAINKAFSSDELGNLSDSVGSLVRSGFENIFGTEFENITEGTADVGNVAQALTGTLFGGLTDALNNFTEMSEGSFQLQEGYFDVNTLNVNGTNANDFTVPEGKTKAVLTNDGFIIPSVNDTVSGVDLTAGARGANLGSLVNNTTNMPEKNIKVEFTGLPTKIPIELNGINMGDFNWRGLIGNSLFMQNLKATLIDTNLTTAPDMNNERELARYPNLNRYPNMGMNS